MPKPIRSDCLRAAAAAAARPSTHRLVQGMTFMHLRAAQHGAAQHAQSALPCEPPRNRLAAAKPPRRRHRAQGRAAGARALARAAGGPAAVGGAVLPQAGCPPCAHPGPPRHNSTTEGTPQRPPNSELVRVVELGVRLRHIRRAWGSQGVGLHPSRTQSDCCHASLNTCSPLPRPLQLTCGVLSGLPSAPAGPVSGPEASIPGSGEQGGVLLGLASWQQRSAREWEQLFRLGRFERCKFVEMFARTTSGRGGCCPEAVLTPQMQRPPKC